MKISSLVGLSLFNGVAIILASLVYSDRVWRVDYWRSLGFTPSTVYYPFLYVTSAAKGSAYIAGALTVDWIQVIAVVLVILDAGSIIGILRRRNARAGPINA